MKSGWASINIIKFIFAMTIGKIKPSATLVAQFPAGVEVEAIQHEGRVFLPVMGMGDFAAKEEPAARTQEPAPAAPAAPAKKDAEKPAAGGKKYTEDELMDMETKDLLKLCKSMGIDPDATEGKNTNKKLRLLVLEAQEKGGGEGDPAEPAGEGDDDELVAQVTEVLEDFDRGNCNKKKAISRLCALAEDADKSDITDLVEEFEGDGDAEIEDYAAKIAAALRGEEPAKKEAPKSKKKGGKKEDENLVSVDDLEVGDRVSVYWDDDNQDWFDGEVKSIKKGKVLIAYDDDTEDYIDPEVHTKIKKLDD